MRVPFGPFEPDKSQFNGSTSANIVNARPVANGWGPMPDLTAISDSLGSECLGAVFVRTSTGTFRTVAATATAIFELKNTDYSWTDISGPSAPYSASERWSFTRFGDVLLIHNISDPIQKYDINAGGTVADLGGSPPQAKYSCVVGDFVVLGNLSGAETTVHWSGYNDCEHWTVGDKGSDTQEIPEGGEIFSIFGDRGGFYVIQRDGMQYFSFALDSPYIFTRTVINPNQGAVSPRSVVNIGNGRFYYLSEDGFFAGADRTPIGAERVDKWILSVIDPAYLHDVSGAVDPYEKIVWWVYQTATGSKNMVGYDWQLDRWCMSDKAVADVFPLVTIGVTWDGVDDLYASIDEVDVPFDYRLFMDGRPTLAAFDTDNKLAFFTGANLEATFDTSFFQPDDAVRASVTSARLTTDASAATVTVISKSYHGDADRYSREGSMTSSGIIPLRADGRIHKIRATIPAQTVWSITSDVDVSVVASGGR